jgi:hypothetical protein
MVTFEKFEEKFKKKIILENTENSATFRAFFIKRRGNYYEIKLTKYAKKNQIKSTIQRTHSLESYLL